MTLSLTQSATAVAPFIQASFLGIGGSGALTYSVLPDGAGGTIDASTGIYHAPSFVQEDPKLLFDTVRVTDATSATATARILVGSPLLLLCEIVQRELSLPDGYIYIWNQKINQPKDSLLYIAVSVMHCKPFGSVNWAASVPSVGMNSEQFLAMRAIVDIDVISRSTAALNRKEEVIMALSSVYSLQQQDANSFYIARLPLNFINLSQVDGAAIPYRYKISVAIQYAQPRVKPAEYFDTFGSPQIFLDPAEELDTLDGGEPDSEFDDEVDGGGPDSDSPDEIDGGGP